MRFNFDLKLKKAFYSTQYNNYIITVQIRNFNLIFRI